MLNDKQFLAGLCFNDLEKLLSAYPSFRSRQIHEWICRGAAFFDDMSSLPKSLREELEQKFRIHSGEVSSEQKEKDGTVKIGITLEDGAVTESVLLKDGKDRKTACLSTQAGCPLGCVFCKTGALGFMRNLTGREIATQFLCLKKREEKLSHIVIMGMGEPFLNLEELRAALDFFMESEGLNISKRRITVSTSGIPAGIIDLAANGPDIRLALSLVTAREDLRRRLMPGSGENLSRVKEALLVYQEKKARRVTAEMVLLGGLNTSLEDAKAAREFAKGLGVVFNLIPWNPVPGLEFEGRPLKVPTPEEINFFAKALESYGLKVTRRMSKGRGISGACGQLGSL